MKRILLILVISVILILSGCSDSKTGSVSLQITDAPVDSADITAVKITVTGVAYHTTVPDEWVEFNFENPMEFDLLSLTNGTTAMIDVFELPAGEISQLRFYLDAAVTGDTTPSNPGCSVTLLDTSEEPLFVPSADQSGFKATGAFTVPLNGTVNIIADFDARKSITYATNHYVLRPTIRLAVTDEAGSIAGDITYGGTNTVVVFAYENDTFSAATELTVNADGVLFANSVTSSVLDETGYVLSYLAAGTYDLVTAEFDATGEYVADSFKTTADVAVASGDETLQNIDITN